MASVAKVFPPSGESIRRTRSDRITRQQYRAAIADVIREVKATHKLTNEALGDTVGCHEDTIKNAENEAGNLDAVTLLNIALEYGEEAIRPVRALYAREELESPSVMAALDRAEAAICAARNRIVTGGVDS